MQNSGQLFPMKCLRFNFTIRGLIKLVIINMTHTCMESYPLIGIGPAFSSCSKRNVVWFLPIRFVDLARVWSLHIVSRNHLNTFVDMQINKWLHLSSSLGGFIWRLSLHCYMFRKKIDHNWILLDVWRSVNCYFLLRFSRYSGEVWQKKEKLTISKYFALKIVSKIYLTMFKLTIFIIIILRVWLESKFEALVCNLKSKILIFRA